MSEKLDKNRAIRNKSGGTFSGPTVHKDGVHIKTWTSVKGNMGKKISMSDKIDQKMEEYIPM